MTLRNIVSTAGRNSSGGWIKSVIIGMLLTSFAGPILIVLLFVGMMILVSGVTDPADFRSEIAAELEGGWGPPTYGRITSLYGPRTNAANSTPDFHTGLDVANGCGSPIFSIADGTVTGIRSDIWGGISIWVEHTENLTTRYHHSYMDEIYVKQDQQVVAGQHIADQGSSGLSAGCHLHFEVFVGGGTTSAHRLDPTPFLKSLNVYDLITTGKPIQNNGPSAEVCTDLATCNTRND